MSVRKKRRNRYEFLTKKFPKRMQKKLVLLFIVVILAFIALVIRITYINASKGSGYTKIVLDQQEYGSRVIPFKRGDIVDRNGTKIAVSERVYNVILDVYVMLSKKDYAEPTIEVLKDCFGISEEKVRELIKESPDSRYEILEKGVSYETAQKFAAIEEDTKKYPNVKGIWLEEAYKRSYPYGSLACDVIGFSGSGNVGAIGMESAYNDVLNGTNGREYGYFNDDATMERTVKPAKSGNTVVSTIDVTLQSIVEQCILEFNQAHNGETRQGQPGSKNTAVIMMNPNTGEILAEASYPNFDLNSAAYPNLEPDVINSYNLPVIYREEEQENGAFAYVKSWWENYTDELWSSMSDAEREKAMNALWRNFCVSDAYEPGSTIKPFTVATGLETGALAGNETYVCGGSLHVGGWNIGCHLRSGHGTETIQDAVANSCNVALMQMAEAIGVEDFTRYQHIFGFGEYTGIDLPGEAYTKDLLFTKDTMQITDLATNSFGQSFNVTMTQMAAGFCSLVNGGNYYEPHVVKQIQDEDGKVIETKDPVLLRKTISKETSEQLKPYLRAVLEEGTGKGAAVEGYDIGGKTGTAEKLPRGNDEYVLSFIGCAPLNNPQVVIYVVIDEPNVPDQGTSKYVLELAQKIMAQTFPYLNIPTKEGYVPGIASAENQNENAAGDTEPEYTDYDASYEDTYSYTDGAYVDENYNPDLDDWTGSNTTTE